MKTKNELIASALIFLFFLSILALSIKAGNDGKVFLSMPEIRVVSSPEEAILFWKEAGLKGRVIYRFDTTLSNEALENFASKDNLLYIAVIENISREINYIIPDTIWDKITRYSLDFDKDMPLDEPINTYMAGGTPFNIMKLSHVSTEQEPVIIISGGSQWETAAVMSLIEKSVLKSDVLTFTEVTPNGFLERLKNIIGTFK